ncbi:MAG: peptide deformylase [Bryobacterales bacterium]
MAILKVAQIGHPVLRLVSRPVEPDEIASPAFQRLCDDMLETLDEYDGAGLAAPQVHVPVRLAVLTLTEERGPEFFVNPVITVLPDAGVRRTWEGCLSVEGYRGLVERPDSVRVVALDRDGSEKVLEIQGFGAVVLQHEFDHLDGVLYVDKILPRSLVALPEFRRWGPPAEYADVEADVDDEDLDMDDLDDEGEEADEDAVVEEERDGSTFDDESYDAEV